MTPIDCLVVSKYTDKEIIVYSDTSCCFYLDIDITDGDYQGHHNKLFEISSGETLKLTINDIFPDFYSDEAIIDSVYYHGHAYSYCSESKTPF